MTRAPTMADAEADAAQTLAAIARFERDLVVQAGAGTGKTHALVTLYLHLVGGLTASAVRSPPNRIVVITFTDKAATELKQRIRERLTPLADGTAKGADASLATVEQPVWQTALAQLGRAPVGTFHAFAGTLLRQYSARAGLPADFRLLDEVDARRLLDESAERAVLSALDDPHPGYVETVERLINDLQFHGTGHSTGLVEQLTQLAARRADEGRPPTGMAAAYTDERIVDDERRAQQAWHHALDELQALLPQLRAKTLDRASELTGRRDVRPDEVAALYALTKDWRGEGVKPTVEALRHALDGMTAAHASRRAQPAAHALERLLATTLQIYQASKRRRAALDFSDLLVQARDLLADETLRAEVQERYDAVLVDEFQDTNEVQADLIDRLAGPPRPFGRRFVVGDRKQSIYEFRGADVAVFTRVSRGLVEAGAQTRVLRSSRRSRPELVAFLNDLFAVVMRASPTASPDWALRFDPATDALLPVKAPLSGAGARLIVCAAEPGQNAAALRQREARAIAAQMHALHKKGRPFGQMALLLRSYTPLGIYVDALRAAAIPHYIVRGRGLYSTQEARDVLSLATLLVDGDDRGALVALLRSPLVALSDESLLRLRLLRRLRLDLLDRVETLATLPADEAERLLRFCGVLRDVQPRVVLTTAEACIRDVVDGLDLPAVLAATRQGPSRVANLERLVDHAARFAERGTLAAFAGWLRGRMARGDEAEEAQAFDEGDDVVRVMTAHQAKGLQFPVVFIPDCGGSGRADAGHVRYAPSLGLGVRARPDNPLDRWDPTFPFTRVAEHNGERRRAESLRLLYVAATRAEDLVIFSGEGRGWRAELDGWRAATSQADLLTIVDDHQLPAVRVARAEQLALIPPSTEAAAWVRRAYATPPLVPRVLTVAVTALHTPSGAPEQFFARLDSHEGDDDERLDPLARGSLAHRLLERCRFGDAGTVDAELHAAGYAVDDPAATEIRADVQRFLQSPFGRSLAGRRLRRELPFLLALPLGKTQLQLRGQIDLAIFDDDGITLVDYKDARSATSKGDGATSSQRRQLEAYALAAHRLYPRAPTIRAALVFLKDADPAPRYLVLPAPDAIAARLAADGRALLGVLSKQP